MRNGMSLVSSLDGCFRPEIIRTTLVGMERWDRGQERLLEKPSDDPIESEILTVLWTIVEMVDEYDIVPGRDPQGSPDQRMNDSEEEIEVTIEHNPICSRCGHSEQVILSRGFGWEDYLSIQDMGHGTELICQSCVVVTTDVETIDAITTETNENLSGNFYCVDCGYSEALCKQFHGEQLGLFYLEGETRPERQDRNTRCQGCRARFERYEQERYEQDAAQYRAGRIDDGIDDDIRVNRVLFHENEEEDLITVVGSEEWTETYEGELEPVEDGEDNNDEKSLRIKKTVQEMGEVLFDIKENITEGAYVRLMDGLQSITNEMNH